MRKHTAIAAALLVALLGIGSAQTNGTAVKRPVLGLVDKQPVKLRGLSFNARERVRVTIWAHELRRARVVRATARGTFTVEFDVTLDRCMGLDARATGADGSRATYKLPQPFCPPN